MNLKDAIEFTFETRRSWREGSGARTTRINTQHLIDILGEDFDVLTTTSDTFDYITEVLLEQGKKGGTINRITTALSTILGQLRKKNKGAPKVEFERQPESKGRVSYYTEDEVDRILESSTKEKDGLLLHDSILFSIKTGCRQGELLELSVDDIDITKRTILFRDTKNGTDHWLTMNEDLVPVMERRIERQIGGLLFPWANKDQLLRSFKAHKTLAGLPEGDGRVWHTLRHSVATWLCEKDVPLRTVMGVLNHKRVETTLRYAKASDRAMKSAINML